GATNPAKRGRSEHACSRFVLFRFLSVGNLGRLGGRSGGGRTGHDGWASLSPSGPYLHAPLLPRAEPCSSPRGAPAAGRTWAGPKGLATAKRQIAKRTRFRRRGRRGIMPGVASRPVPGRTATLAV